MRFSFTLPARAAKKGADMRSQVYRLETADLSVLPERAVAELLVCGVSYQTFAYSSLCLCKNGGGRRRKSGAFQGPDFVRAANDFLNIEADDRASWWNPFDPPQKYLARRLFDRVKETFSEPLSALRLYVTLGTDLDWWHHADLLFVWGHACFGIDVTADRNKHNSEGLKRTLSCGREVFRNLILSPSDFRDERLLAHAARQASEGLLAIDEEERTHERKQPFGSAFQVYCWNRVFDWRPNPFGNGNGNGKRPHV